VSPAKPNQGDGNVEDAKSQRDVAQTSGSHRNLASDGCQSRRMRGPGGGGKRVMHACQAFRNLPKLARQVRVVGLVTRPSPFRVSPNGEEPGADEVAAPDIR
jgi:hypothetical protein